MFQIELCSGHTSNFFLAIGKADIEFTIVDGSLAEDENELLSKIEVGKLKDKAFSTIVA